MCKEEKIILYDSDEACQSANIVLRDGRSIPVWVVTTNHGAQVYMDERLARYAGCTHQVCPETGEVFKKHYINGPTVRARLHHERWLALPETESGPDGCTKMFWGCQFVDDVDELVKRVIESLVSPEDFFALTDLNWAEPKTYPLIDESVLTDDVPEDCGQCIPDAILEKLKALNKAIEDNGTEWYESHHSRPTDAQLAAFEQAIAKAIAEWKSESGRVDR